MSGVKGRSGGKRPGAGRTPFAPTNAQRVLVGELFAFGTRQIDVCLFIKDESGKPISEPTLLKYFPEEVATGRLQANFKVAKTLYKKAIAGDTASIIFWLKVQAGWREPQRVELTGPNSGPIQSVALSANEFQAIAEKIALEV